MTALTSQTVLAVFLIFCRIGGCLMLMPGFSSARIPARVRLFIAIAVTLALAPLLLDTVKAAAPDDAPATLLRSVASESVTGLLIGLLGRLMFMALETMATAVVMAIGFNNLSGVAIEENEAVAPLVTLVTTGATLLFFLTDLHWEVLRALLSSYRRLPPGEDFGAQFDLIAITDQLRTAFVLALRITSPFIVYSVIVNFAVGIVNKMVPQIPVYFIATPFIIAGGFFILYFLAGEILTLFATSFSSWLLHG